MPIRHKARPFTAGVRSAGSPGPEGPGFVWAFCIFYSVEIGSSSASTAHFSSSADPTS